MPEAVARGRPGHETLRRGRWRRERNWDPTFSTFGWSRHRAKEAVGRSVGGLSLESRDLTRLGVPSHLYRALSGSYESPCAGVPSTIVFSFTPDCRHPPTCWQPQSQRSCTAERIRRTDEYGLMSRTFVIAVARLRPPLGWTPNSRATRVLCYDRSNIFRFREKAGAGRSSQFTCTTRSQ
jgi:hypothetical protein